VLSREATNTNFIVFGLPRPELKPTALEASRLNPLRHQYGYKHNKKKTKP